MHRPWRSLAGRTRAFRSRAVTSMSCFLASASLNFLLRESKRWLYTVSILRECGLLPDHAAYHFHLRKELLLLGIQFGGVEGLCHARMHHGTERISREVRNGESGRCPAIFIDLCHKQAYNYIRHMSERRAYAKAYQMQENRADACLSQLLT